MRAGGTPQAIGASGLLWHGFPARGLAVRRQHRLWHGLPARGLAVRRQHRSYSTDASKSAALFIEQQKDRLGDCLYRWSTIDRCRIRHPWAGSPCHVIVLFFLCLAMLGSSVVQARADDEPPPNLLK